MIYSVFVGKYENANISKNDLIKLNTLGLKGYLFAKDNYYSLKVGYYINNEAAANSLANALAKRGFITFVEKQEIKHK